jgi:AcrR family transcriptional regulator
LLEAAATVIAERGYEAATMAEIASRAGALVGSLYHFFPNKESLADALIGRYGEVIDEAFDRIDRHVISLPLDNLADALLDLLVEVQSEVRAMRALLEAREDFSAKRQEFRSAALGHIAHTLRLRIPGLNPETAQSMAVILLHNMKLMKALTAESGEPADPGAAAELRQMTRAYLASKITDQV